MLSKDILKGLVDMHVHAGPSTARRSFDSFEMLEQAEAAGYKGFVIKDHNVPSIMTSIILDKHVSKGCRVLGGVVLNTSVGGINTKMVEVCYNMGARIVWLPTMSAKWDMDTRVGKFVGAGNTNIPEKPVCYLKEDGTLTDDIMELLRWLADHKDMVLATGHCSIKETTAMVKVAKSMGIEKILINHPYNTVKATYEEAKVLADMGCYIEITAVCFKGVGGSEKFDVELLRPYFDNIPHEQLVIDGDIGAMTKAGPLYAVDAMYKFLCLLNEKLGITEEDIDLMAKEVPSRLLGI